MGTSHGNENDTAFHEAYSKATKMLMQAVLDFERATGRSVDSIELCYIDITRIEDEAPKKLRHTSLHFLPKLGEIAS